MTASVGVQAFLFDIGWGELVLIGVVALIVIGPKDLPVVLRTVGQYTSKIRRMAAEFQSQFQEAMREAEMADLKQHFDAIQDAAKDIRGFDPVGTVRNQIESAAADKPAHATPSALAPSSSSASEPAAVGATAEPASAVPNPSAVPVPAGGEAPPPAAAPQGTVAVEPGASMPEVGKGQPG